MPTSGSRSKDDPPRREEGAPRLAIEGVTPGYFRAVGIDLLEGRDFDERDYEPDAPGVFIVNETLARRFWPGESAVGKRLVGGESPPKDGRWSTVVGVVKDMRREGLDVAPILGAFIPAFPRSMDLTIRASTGGDDLIPAVRQEIRAIDAALPLPPVVTADGHLSERLGGRRFESQALGVFAAIALLLSAAGLYALLAYQVALRTREIGIRSALGADRQTIVTMILGKGVGLTAGRGRGRDGRRLREPSACKACCTKPPLSTRRAMPPSRVLCCSSLHRRVAAGPARGTRQPDDRAARGLGLSRIQAAARN